MITVRRLYPNHVTGTSRWDGQPVQVITRRDDNDDYPWLVQDTRGNRAWVATLTATGTISTWNGNPAT